MSRLKRSTLPLHSCDGRSQPLLDAFLKPLLVTAPLDSFDGLARIGQRDVMTWYNLALVFRRNEVHQQALAASVSSHGIAEVQTTQRILKN